MPPSSKHRQGVTKRPQNHTRPTSTSIRTTNHDHDTGLVYDEFEISAARGASTWITDYKTPNIVRTRVRPNDGGGARSLVEMALTKLGLESQQLTSEALEPLPWVIGQKIWNRICENHSESYYIWRTFAVAFKHDFADPSFRYMLQIRTPSLPLIDYYRGLSDPHWRWDICLRISPKQVAVPDLIAISVVQNLSVLDLSDGQLYIENRESTFDHRVVRTWSEGAISGRGFRNLRVLLLGWQEKIDVWLFEYLNKFPKLNIVVLSNCRSLHHKNHKDWEDLARSQGWEFMPSKRGVKHLRPLFDDKSFGKGIISNMHYESLRSYFGDKGIPPKVQRPVLECWLGSPREWAHIIDDFPGTGTIFLQKKSNFRQNMSTKVAADNKQPDSREVSRNITTLQSQRQAHSFSHRRRSNLQSAASVLADMDFGYLK